jgi:hypothetical protein
MFVKWPKTFRILISQVNIKGKHFLSDEETKLLLAGEVSLQEKIDGANTGIIRTKDGFKLQKRGSLVGQSEHIQFGAFIAWSNRNYMKLIQLPKDTILYGEWCFARHTIFYNKLPDYFLAFALYDVKTGSLRSRDEMTKLCDNIGLSYVPEVARGYFKKDDLFSYIPNISNFGDSKAEGIVVEKIKNGSRGKIVREEFVKNIEEDDHWSKKSIVRNLLKDSKWK